MATRVRTEPRRDTLLNRELSHLEFHARVLELATDESLPLLERVKFCCDLLLEPRRVLPGAGRRPPRARPKPGIAMRSADGLTPHQALARIRERVLELSTLQSTLWKTGAPARRSPPKASQSVASRTSAEGAREARASLPPRDLPGADAACGRAGPAVPVHLRSLALARDLRRGPRGSARSASRA